MAKLFFVRKAQVSKLKRKCCGCGREIEVGDSYWRHHTSRYNPDGRTKAERASPVVIYYCESCKPPDEQVEAIVGRSATRDTRVDLAGFLGLLDRCYERLQDAVSRDLGMFKLYEVVERDIVFEVEGAYERLLHLAEQVIENEGSGDHAMRKVLLVTKALGYLIRFKCEMSGASRGSARSGLLWRLRNSRVEERKFMATVVAIGEKLAQLREDCTPERKGTD